MLIIKRVIKYAELPDDPKKEKLGNLIKRFTTSGGLLKTVPLYKAIDRLGGWHDPSPESDAIGLDPYDTLCSVYVKDQIDAALVVHSDMGALHLVIV